jgi:hypothetical protein
MIMLPAILFCQAQVNITRTDTPPVIDGILSEDVWDQAMPVTEFFQREPDIGAPVSEKTEFFMLYDDNFLYIGIRCYDDPARVIAKEMARDADLSNDDRIQIILDTHLDGRNAYWFQIGPRGSLGDGIISENGLGFNRQWKGLWDGRASIRPHGWEAEIIIPFKTLNFEKGQTTWGVKFIRYIRRNLEASYWPGSNINAHRRQVSDAGHVTGLENITQGVGLDINPYGISGHDLRQPAGGLFMADGGVDIFYQISPALSSVLTLNTDFAETEVDSRQINLTRFSLHFPEKRDFFLDGANYFNFGIGGELDNPYNKRLIPFFSRRLGLDAGGELLPVYAGGRLTGQAGNWNIGFVNILQERMHENSNFTAMRVARNIGRESSAGMIATIGNSIGEGNNILYGLDAKIATSTFAGNKNVSFIAYGLQSVTDKPPEHRQTDKAFGAELNYPNDLFFGRAGLLHIDKDFKAGIGFVPRTGIRELYVSAGAGPRPGRWGILQVQVKGGIDHISDLDGNLQTREIQFTPLDIRFRTGELFSLSAVQMHEQLFAAFKLLDSITIPLNTYDFRTYSISATSAQQKNFWGGVTYEWGDFFDGTKKTMKIETGWQALVHLFVGSEFEKSFLALPGGEIDVGIYRLIMNVLFNPRINLFTFIQYDDVTETSGWQSRFQWIIRPGREVLLVWNSNIHNPMDRFAITESSLRFKLKYNIRF